MLILENLTYQAAKRSFMNSTRKFIKFSINQHIIITKQIAKVKSPTLLQWEESVSLPLFLNAKYHFEMYQEHKFGYNPQELNSIACGTFTINEDDTYSSWQVVSDRGNKLGFLSSKIRRKLRYVPNETAPVQNQIMTISSIITHLSFLKQKRGYIVITVGSKSYKTETSKSKAGQLLFTDRIEIQKTDQIVQAKVQVFSFDAKQNKSELIASGILKMDSEHLEKKVIVDNQKNETADVYFDYKITSKQLYNSSKELSKIVQRNSLLNRSTVDHITNYSASRTLNQSSLYSSELKTQRTKGPKPSIVHHNNNVFIPSQKRFMQYADKPSNIVSYLRERDELDFKDGHSKIYYKGASIGIGQKCDFSNVFRTNPGVGSYHLPSLWDRY